MTQAYFLRFTSHQSSLSKSILSLLTENYCTDVHLSAGNGQIIQAHKIILSAFSPYFKSLFSNLSKDQFPIILIREMSHETLKSIIEFCYRGEILVAKDKLDDVVSAAKFLQIEGAKDFILPQMNEQNFFNTNTGKVQIDLQAKKSFGLNNQKTVIQQPKQQPKQQQQQVPEEIVIEDDNFDKEEQIIPNKDICMPNSFESLMNNEESQKSGMFSEFEENDKMETENNNNDVSIDDKDDDGIKPIQLKLPPGTVVSTKIVTKQIDTNQALSSTSSLSSSNNVIFKESQKPSAPIVPNMKTLRLSSATARAIAASAYASITKHQPSASSSSLTSKIIPQSVSPLVIRQNTFGTLTSNSGFKRGRGRPRKYESYHTFSLSPSHHSSSIHHNRIRGRGRPSLSSTLQSQSQTQMRYVPKTRYKCPHCPQIYYVKSGIQDHIKNVHLNGAKYTCHICKREYTWRLTLRQHLKSVHGIHSKHSSEEQLKNFSLENNNNEISDVNDDNRNVIGRDNDESSQQLETIIKLENKDSDDEDKDDEAHHNFELNTLN